VLSADVSSTEVVAHPIVREHIQGALKKLCSGDSGSSMRITRALLLLDPPSLDLGEITDKGYINQRAVLRARPGRVDKLYAEPPSAELIVMHPDA